MSDALLTFSIGPVHTFIGQARRIADLWAGSQILSDLVREAVKVVLAEDGGKLVFPLATLDDLPKGLPNLFVARVPLAVANDVAERMKARVAERWKEIVEHGVAELRSGHFDIGSDPLARHLWKDAIQCSWSWVAEDGNPVEAARAGADLHAASRVYRPFEATGDRGLKCAICGERNALPDGDRRRVIEAWKALAARHETDSLSAFVRLDQTRLCLVCASKRFYARLVHAKDPRTIFESLEAFQPDDKRPYFALVTMDGDYLGRALRNSSEKERGRISVALNRFADSLRTDDSADLNLRTLEMPWPPPSKAPEPNRRRPQLIYAGGDDVLFVSDPRDALDCAMAIRAHYGQCFAEQGFAKDQHTISGAIVLAHTKIPSGRLLREAEELLKRKAKATRNAVAIALHKRSGPPVETTFPWDGDAVHAGHLRSIVQELTDGYLASRQTFYLGEEQRVLADVFTTEAQWKTWLEWRLSRGERSSRHVTRLATLLAPLFTAGVPRVEALRIARFLAIDVAPKRRRVARVTAGGVA